MMKYFAPLLPEEEDAVDTAAASVEAAVVAIAADAAAATNPLAAPAPATAATAPAASPAICIIRGRRVGVYNASPRG